MKPAILQLIRAPLLSASGFISRALLFTILFALCEFAGWREHTTFISGTTTSVDMDSSSSVTLGVIYILAYFGFVLVAPALFLAATILVLWQRYSPRTSLGKPHLASEEIIDRV